MWFGSSSEHNYNCISATFVCNELVSMHAHTRRPYNCVRQRDRRFAKLANVFKQRVCVYESWVWAYICDVLAQLVIHFFSTENYLIAYGRQLFMRFIECSRQAQLHRLLHTYYAYNVHMCVCSLSISRESQRKRFVCRERLARVQMNHSECANGNHMVNRFCETKVPDYEHLCGLHTKLKEM